MDKMNVKILRVLIQENGVKGLISDLAHALSQEADDLSDMGLKERSIEAAHMSDMLFDVKNSMDN